MKNITVLATSAIRRCDTLAEAVRCPFRGRDARG
jgi:hypothetical protein